MPLNTQIFRDGKNLDITWEPFHAVAMEVASALDEDYKLLFDRDPRPENYPDDGIVITASDVWTLMSYAYLGNTPVGKKGRQTLKHRHKLVDALTGEELELQPGDVLRMWRSQK